MGLLYVYIVIYHRSSAASFLSLSMYLPRNIQKKNNYTIVIYKIHNFIHAKPAKQVALLTHNSKSFLFYFIYLRVLCTTDRVSERERNSFVHFHFSLLWCLCFYLYQLQVQCIPFQRYNTISKFVFPFFLLLLVLVSNRYLDYYCSMRIYIKSNYTLQF